MYTVLVILAISAGLFAMSALFVYLLLSGVKEPFSSA
jgi:hypothetical protein